MLTIPEHIRASGVAGAPITYKWHGTDDYNRERPELMSRFQTTSIRGVLALASGIAEWIAWRLDELSSYHASLQFIEGVWAGQVAPEYLIGWDSEHEPDLEGPAERPLYHTCELLLKVYNRCDADDTGGASRWSVYLTYLARHVLPKPKTKVFDAWLVAALDRMAAAYPRRKSDPLGVPVPREALDIGVPFDPARSAELVGAFLAALDPALNPYLAPPKQMRADGFTGTPYRYP